MQTTYKLRDWISPHYVYGSMYISCNPHPAAMEWLKANPKLISWIQLSLNPSNEAIELLKANPKKINWDMLSCNTNDKAIELLTANPDKINWAFLSKNSSDRAIGLIRAYSKRVDWPGLICNPNPSAHQMVMYAFVNKLIPDFRHDENGFMAVMCAYNRATLPADAVLAHVNDKDGVMTVIRTYMYDTNVVDIVEGRLRLFRSNTGIIEWKDLNALWSNPGIFVEETLPTTSIDNTQEELSQLKSLVDKQQSLIVSYQADIDGMKQMLDAFHKQLGAQEDTDLTQ